MNTDNILVSNKISSGGKNNYESFAGFLYDDHKIKSLHIMLLKTKAYLKDYGGQTKLIYFLIEYINLLNKCNTI